MSLAEFSALPEDNSQLYELREGVFQTFPKAGAFHQLVLSRTSAALDLVAPAEWTAVLAPEVVVDGTFPATVRVPDVIVMSLERILAAPAHIYADDVLLAVEVVPPVDDLGAKHAEYAEAGIPHYWILDIAAQPKLTAYRLVDGVYEQDFNGTGVFMTEQPFDLRIDLDALRTRIVPKRE